MSTTETKKGDMLDIDPPSELHFCGPFSRPVVTVMKLSNTTDKTYLFKIKTTAPKRYCVRPNFGTVSPYAVAKVEICLQPFEYDPNDKNKHKFMVQSLVAPEGPLEDLNKVWKEADPEKIVDAKLKCIFDMPKEPVIEPEKVQAFPFNDMRPAPGNIISHTQEPHESELIAELRQLREENSNLRKESTQLKELTLRLKAQVEKPDLMNKPYTPMQVEKPVPMFYIAIAIAAAIFGLLLGKYLL